MAASSRRKAPTTSKPVVAGPEAPSALALDSVLDLDAATPLRAAILERRGSDLTIDGSAVRHLGGLCAQVLASAASTWAGDGRSLSFRSPSEAFVQGVSLLGLDTILTIGA